MFKGKSYRKKKKVLNLTHSEQWLEASMSDWDFGNKTQQPFSKNKCGFPSFFSLKGFRDWKPRSQYECCEYVGVWL